MTDTERLLGDHMTSIDSLEDDFSRIDGRLEKIGPCPAGSTRH